MCIKSDAKNGQQYQKWLFVVREILSKIGIGFISNFLLKARVLFHSSLNAKFSLSFVWFYQSVFLSKFVAFHPLTVKRIVTALMPNLLFRCFFLFLPHLRTQAQGKRSGNCLRFGTGGPSLCLYPLLSRKILFFPALTMAARAKKNFWRSDLLTLSPCTIGILSTLSYTEFDCAALLAML